MTVPDSTNVTPQPEGEGTEADSSSKPPNSRQQTSTMLSSPSSAPHPPTPMKTPRKSAELNGANTAPRSGAASPTPPPHPKKQASVPIPAPEAHAYPKEPGFTRRELTALARKPSAQSALSSVSGDSDGPSPPQSRSQSRANSQSGPRPAILRALSSASKGSKKDAVLPPGSPDPSAVPAPTSSGKAPSIRSEDGGQKFTLKDLLSSGPKLSRRNSQRSVGSSKSSDGGRSATGDSATSLLKKYGVCEKVAIGKGATSVVRLAHKWDRTEEKLYAVKVRCRDHHFSAGSLAVYLYIYITFLNLRNSASAGRTRPRRST
jgi:protein-serine/threonine kinase